MPKRFILAPPLELDELAAYHRDVLASLGLYFSPSAPTFTERFAGKTVREVNDELQSRLDETDIRSTLAVLTSLEAHFRIDFDFRCKERKKDLLSRHFRQVERARGKNVRLDEDIFEGWKEHGSAPSAMISQLRGAFKFRHWIAHGRYWNPKRKYDFTYSHLIAEGIITELRLAY